MGQDGTSVMYKIADNVAEVLTTLDVVVSVFTFVVSSNLTTPTSTRINGLK